MTDSTSNLAIALAGGKFVVTAELAPPVATDPAAFIARALAAEGIATAVTSPTAPAPRRMSRASPPPISSCKAASSRVLQMTCRDRNRLALQGDLLGAIALGMRNLLVLSGDDPKLGDQPEAKPVFDYKQPGAPRRGERDAARSSLLPPHRRSRARRSVPRAADLPIDPPPDWNPKSLIAKVEAGADFVQTQFCMDVEIAAALCRAACRARHRA